MSYKKISLSIAVSMLLGTFASAQTEPQKSLEFAPNSIIAYFAEDGTLLPDRNGSEYYRYFKDIVSGCFLVQDFYSINDQKQTDPVCFTDPEELQSWFPQSMQGPLTFWDIQGYKIQEGYSQQDGGRSGFWKSWDQFGNMNEYELIDGELIVSYFDVDGNRQATPSEGGTFRTLIDFDEDTSEYLVADYFSDTRTRQMDPVVIQREDLLRWDIQYRNGTYAYYNDEGTLTTLEEYYDGRLHGNITTWYQDVYPAQKYDELTFTDGQQTGLYVRWYPNGYPKLKVTVDNNEITAIECWDDQFQTLSSDVCPALFDESYNNEDLGIELENDAAIDAEPAIEIIIPDEEELAPAAVEDAVESETIESNATVIFPQDDSAEAVIDETDIEAIVEGIKDEYQAEAIEEAIVIEPVEQVKEETEGKKILKSIQNIFNAM